MPDGISPALVMAIFITMVISFCISIPSLRLRGDFFVLATLGFQIIIYSILNNLTDITNGPYGISGIPVINIAGWSADNPFRFFIVCCFFLLLFLLLLASIIYSPFGRILIAVREDEVAASSLGKNIALQKIIAFALSAALAAIPGALFASYMRYIDPTSFTIMESVFILSIVVVGGAGNIRGPVIGAIVLIFLPELLRFLRIPDAIAANLRQIIYGLALVLMVRFRPQGIDGDYGFD